MRSTRAKELHRLIHVLTPHEKRYLKRYANIAGQRENNNYLHLFDLLHDMAEYSDAELEAQISGTAYAGHLPSTQHHLNQLILRSLRAFHTSKSELSRLREQMDFAHILVAKAQFVPALRLLRRLRKKAEALEAHHLQLEATQLSSQLLLRTPSRNRIDQVEANSATVGRLLDQLQSAHTLIALDYQHKALRLQKLDLRSDPDRFNAIMDHPYLANVPAAPNLQARSAWLTMKGFDALARRAYESAYTHFSTAVQDWQKLPRQISEFPAQYLRQLTNLLNACIYSKRLHEADRIMQQLQDVPIRTRADALAVLNLSAYTQLFYCLNRGRYAEGVQVANQIKSLLDEHGSAVPANRRINFFYNITIFYFLHEQYREALSWLNRLLQIPNSDLRQNLQDFARIFQMILHYELGNRDLIEYLFRSAYRYYQGKPGKETAAPRVRMHEFEQILFQTMREVTFRDGELEALAPEMYEKLWALARNADGKEPAGLYEIIFWVQSKVEQIGLKAIYEKRVVARAQLVDEKEKGADAAIIRELEEKETE